MALARALNHVASSSDAFTRAVDEYKAFTSKTIQEVDDRIAATKLDYEDQKTKFESDYKRRKVELELQFQRDEAVACEAVLTKHGKVSVLKADYDTLRADAAAAKQALQTAVEETRKEADGAHRRALQAALTNKDMEHKANIAEIKAQNEQLLKQIEGLYKTIGEQRDEIKAQRQLTQSVAEAGKQGAITQSFGKA